jgi:hypothetical protein
MQVNVTVGSPAEKENALVRVNGIKPRGYSYIDLLEAVNLSEGENEFVLTATTPSCTSGCGGVLPGYYGIDVQLLNGSEVLCNTSFQIELIS